MTAAFGVSGLVWSGGQLAGSRRLELARAIIRASSSSG